MERPTWNRSRGKCASGIFFIVASAASGDTSASGIGLHACTHAIRLFVKTDGPYGMHARIARPPDLCQ